VEVPPNTWTKKAEYTEHMLLRGVEMLKLVNLEQYAGVMDVGCGNQQLRQEIMRRNSNLTYYGVDWLDHQSSTIIRDFNKNEFFDRQVDLCILSGVLEYIYPSVLSKFISRVCGSCHTLVASYYFDDFFRYDQVRRHKLWVNKLTLVEMVALLRENGFYLDKFLYSSSDLNTEALPREAIFSARKIIGN
jgi:hypothetical protein